MPSKAPRHIDVNPFFHRFAHAAARYVGSSWAFLLGIVAVIVWAASGRYFRYSDTWQLVINTGTTIVTFLMVFLIQHTQNRDAKITPMKFDELIRAVSEARTDLIQMETHPDKELTDIELELRRERERAIQEKRRSTASRRRARQARQNGPNPNNAQ